MSEVTQTLSAIEQGDPHAAEQLLPLVYEELRQLAAQKLAQEKPGQTLQATALVHEADLRLVGTHDPDWEGRRHFFFAAAPAMRDILVEQAPRKAVPKHGGGAQRVEPTEGLAVIESPAADLLAVDEAVQHLPQEQRHLAVIAMLRYFAGLSADETAAVLGMTASTRAREWRFAGAWLVRRLGSDDQVAG
jgi:RNA polymerase sigma factor (TIGR02999 family)